MTATVLSFPCPSPALLAHSATLDREDATLDEMTATTAAVAADDSHPLPGYLARDLGRRIEDTRSLRQQRLDDRAAYAAWKRKPGTTPAAAGRLPSPASAGPQFPARRTPLLGSGMPAPGPRAPEPFLPRLERALRLVAAVLLILILSGAVYLAGVHRGLALAAPGPSHLQQER